MRVNSCRSLPSLFLIAIGLAVFAQRANGQSQPPLRRELVWYQPGDQIQTPGFSPDGKFLVLVTRAYWPDGADAEGLPDSFFKKLSARAKANPRFADPVVKVIDLAGKVVCEVQYGWNPSLSRDDKHVVFSEQVKPITGFRELASPQAGNGIRIFDCETKELTKIADPETGYLDTPFFAPDGGSIVYTENEAVNGAFGGSVGIARFDLQQNREIALVKKEMVASVPCPPANSRQSGLEAFKCSQVKDLTSSFPQIVFHAAPAGSDVIALLGMPIPLAGDMYLAQNYDMNLVSVLPEQRTILPLGKRSMESYDNTTFQAVSGERVLIFSQYWKLFSLATREVLADIGPKNMKLKSIYSPDLRYYLCAEPDGDPNQFVLYRTADGKRLESFPKMAAVYDAVWSPESNRFAIVGVPVTGASAMNHREELVVYSVR
jgi:hypothetical protein